jgi:hypothetical protein
MSAAEDRRHDPRQERPISGLFSDLAREIAHLLRSEVALAKAEVTEKLSQATNGAALVAAGGLVACAGVLFVLAAAALALALVVEPWLAALIVGLVVVGAGIATMLVGRARLRPANLQPQRTMETLREDKRWAESQLGR